jgi:ribonuclease HIII
MASNPKIPTAPVISALLRKAGFERSTKSPTRVRGFSSRTQGYIVGSQSDGSVAVYHESGNSFMITDATVARQVREQERYAQAIEAAGYAVERGAGGLFGPLVVRAAADASGTDSAP